MTVRELSDRFRISPELLASVGVRNASDNEVRELLGIHARLGQDLSGIVFPYRDPRDGSLKGHRVRLGKPLSDGQKYLSEKGCRVVFFAANSGIALTDATVPIVIVEAEKSALALTSLGERHARKLLAIATGGVWGWKRKVGIAQTPSGDRKSRTGPSPSLDWIAWQDRNAIIAYDSNVAGRLDLEKARLALAVELMTRGAKVFIASTPKRRDVNGPDDVIALLGDEEALQMLDRAAPFAAARPVPVPGVLASDVKPEKVRWLWPNRIPLGKVTIFDGDPDEGKSTVSLDLAARLTRGWPMPDESEAEYPASGAVVVSLEDGVADTIRPRLEAAGTALDKVRIVSTIKAANGVEHAPTIPGDLPSIEAAIKNVNAALLVIDPLVAMLGLGTNSYRDQDIRRALAPLVALAERLGVAVICIRHLSKNGGQNPKYRGGGSIGIIGAARAAFLFADAPGQDGMHVMAPVKGNLWPRKPASLEYSIEERDGLPIIAWHGQSPHSAQSLLAQAESAEDSNARADAENFLTEFLKDGPRNAKAVKQEARHAGVAERTLYRAKAGLGIVSKKSGIGDGQHWRWELPNIATAPLKVATRETLASFDEAIASKPVATASSPKIANNDDVASSTANSGNVDASLSDGDEMVRL